MRTSQRIVILRQAVASTLVVMGLAGCATTAPHQVTEIVWPDPPLTPRIRFEGLLRNEADLQGMHAERGGTGWLMEALLGRTPQQLSVLQQPMGVAVSPDGRRLYVTDYAKPGVFVFDFEEGRVRPLGADTVALKRPFGVAVDGAERIYVVDSTARAVQVFDARGGALRVIAHERLERPTGIAVDAARRRIYVADSSSVGSKRQAIHVFDEQGSYVGVLGGQDDASRPPFFPTYLALDKQGNLYATDTLNATVDVFDPLGRHLKTLGERGDAVGMFDKPKGVALDTFGNVYVVDSAWSNVQIFNTEGRPLLFFGGRGYVPGLLFNPTGIAIDRDNRIYVADAFNGRISIYRLINTKADDSLATETNP